MKLSDEQMRAALQKAQAEKEAGTVPEFSTMWAIAENRARARRRRHGMVAGSVAVLALALVMLMPSGDDLLSKVKMRAKYLQAHASYRHTQDAIPVAGSFAMIPEEISPEGEARGGDTIATNILAEEYWEVYSVLMT